jgi:aminodeoxyfutalosine deaminase
VRYITGTLIFDGTRYMPEGTVLVFDGQNLLKEIVLGSGVDPLLVERFEGVLSPGFINVHGHLELAHMKGMIPEKTGLTGFAQHIIGRRNEVAADIRLQHMREADQFMYKHGITAAGDISNTVESFEVKSESKIAYHTFIELIALNPDRSGAVFTEGVHLLEQLRREGLRGSLAPHAPYSVSKELISRIALYDYQQGFPLSIHNQETAEENMFFEGKQNAIHSMYGKLGLDVAWFTPPGTTSLEYYEEVLASCHSVLVHNTFTSTYDVQRVKEKNISWCFCPRANLYIENTLPDYRLFHADKCVVGTDSLASNYDLDILGDANLLLRSGGFSAEQVLRMLTSNAAAALQWHEDFGNLLIGKNTGLNLLDVKEKEIKLKKRIH